MPLIKSASKHALQKNIETEMEAHPGKSHHSQNLAIAYSVARRAAHKKAHGGEIKPHEEEMIRHHELAEDEQHEAEEHERSIAEHIHHKMKLAEGGEVALEEDEYEHPNEGLEIEREALKRKSVDIDQLEEAPLDFNEHGHKIEDEDEEDADIISAIRRRMKKHL